MDTQTTTMTRRTDALPEQTRARPTVAPAVDIYENADEILVVADVPGARREDVTIDLNQGQLTFTARCEAEPDGRALSSEFGARDYHRSFLVPDGIDAERITADLADGVLRIHLPKSPAVKPRRIEVRAG